MCLRVNSDKTEKYRRKNGPIVAWKVLKRDVDGTLMSPFLGTAMPKEGVARTQEGLDVKSLSGLDYIEAGAIHCFLSRSGAREFVRSRPFGIGKHLRQLRTRSGHWVSNAPAAKNPHLPLVVRRVLIDPKDVVGVGQEDICATRVTFDEGRM